MEYLFILSKRRKKQCRSMLRKKKREEMWSRHALTDLTGNRLAGRRELQEFIKWLFVFVVVFTLKANHEKQIFGKG